MASSVPSIVLNNGRSCPIIGLGTWKSGPGQVKDAVKTAISVGYRHIDAAFVYGNEHEVGEGIQEAIAAKEVSREDLFVVSKLWNTKHRAEDVRPMLVKQLKTLKLEYLDLYLIHWPHGFRSGDDPFPKTESGGIAYSDVHYRETWPAMEELVRDGLVRGIGLCNFNSKQIADVLSIATVKPAMLQCEAHPYFNQARLIEFAKAHGIAFTAYSPLGSPDRPWSAATDPNLLEDAKIAVIAARHGKTSAQVLLRFHVDRGCVVIPKSTTPSRIAENFNIFDFKLSESDMTELLALERGWRAVALSRDKEHPLFPFGEEF